LWVNLSIRKKTNFPYQLAVNFSRKPYPELIERDAQELIRIKIYQIYDMLRQVRQKVGSARYYYPKRIHYTIKIYAKPSKKIRGYIDI